MTSKPVNQGSELPLTQASLLPTQEESDSSSPISQGPDADSVGLTIAEASRRMAEGELTSETLTRQYLERIAAIDAGGPMLKSVLELNPDALAIAAERDVERAAGTVRGPLHGVPVLVKDNIDTADTMHTTAGSLALMGSVPAQDATVVARLREAGAVILGKANLSEWANMRGFQSSSGWSGRGGSTKNPHCLVRNPSGSSSGSAAAVAADLATIALGTETNGSIISPASACGVVGFKPTVGLTSRAGVVPISHTQDSVGVMAKSVADVATTLSCLVGVDERDPATGGNASLVGTEFLATLDANALSGARLGVARNMAYTGYSHKADAVFDAALAVLRALGAEIVTDFEIPSGDEIMERPGAFERMVYEFKRDLNAYLTERGDSEFTTLADIIAFNSAHADEELRYFGQNVMEMSEATSDDDAAEMRALDERLQRLSRDEGIDAVLREHRLDALIAPSMPPAMMTDLANGEKFMGAASNLAAIAGYPIITVPAGLAHRMPVGISFTGTAWSDTSILSLAYAWEQATQMYRTPTFYAGDIVADPDTPRFELPVITGDPPGHAESGAGS